MYQRRQHGARRDPYIFMLMMQLLSQIQRLEYKPPVTLAVMSGGFVSYFANAYRSRVLYLSNRMLRAPSKLSAVLTDSDQSFGVFAANFAAFFKDLLPYEYRSWIPNVSNSCLQPRAILEVGCLHAASRDRSAFPWLSPVSLYGSRAEPADLCMWHRLAQHMPGCPARTFQMHTSSCTIQAAACASQGSTSHESCTITTHPPHATIISSSPITPASTRIALRVH